MTTHVFDSLLDRFLFKFLCSDPCHDKPITCFDSISCFEDGDNLNRLILTYLKNNLFKINSFKKLRYEVMEAMKVEAEAIQKLALPHAC